MRNVPPTMGSVIRTLSSQSVTLAWEKLRRWSPAGRSMLFTCMYVCMYTSMYTYKMYTHTGFDGLYSLYHFLLSFAVSCVWTRCDLLPASATRPLMDSIPLEL